MIRARIEKSGRFVRLYHTKITLNNEETGIDEVKIKLKVSGGATPLLQINLEARDFFGQQYRQIFEAALHSPVRICLGKDALFVEDPLTWETLRAMPGRRHSALRHELYDNLRDYCATTSGLHIRIPHRIWKFGQLQRIGFEFVHIQPECSLRNRTTLMQLKVGHKGILRPMGEILRSHHEFSDCVLRRLWQDLYPTERYVCKFLLNLGLEYS